MKSVMSKRKPGMGFTLIELMVVVTIIVVLLSLLAPALDRAVEAAERAVCGANQHAIGAGAIGYAMNNRGALFICHTRSVPLAIAALGTGDTSSGRGDESLPEDMGVDWLAALASAGLASSEKVDAGGGAMQHRPLKHWQCPSLPINKIVWVPATGTPQPNLGLPVASLNGYYGIGYQYLGGILYWKNPFITTNRNSLPSRSPIRLSKSGGGWAIAADMLARTDGVWGNGGNTAHQLDPASQPSGGNNAYIDGSVAWYDFNDSIYIHTWNPDLTRDLFFRQSDLGDYAPPAEAYGKDSRWE